MTFVFLPFFPALSYARRTLCWESASGCFPLFCAFCIFTVYRFCDVKHKRRINEKEAPCPPPPPRLQGKEDELLVAAATPTSPQAERGLTSP